MVLIYFIVLSLIGLVLMVGMFVGVFQDGFLRQQNNSIRNTKLFERVGAIAAFSLLDTDGEAQVPLREFKDFVLSLESNLEMTSVLPAEGLFALLHEDGDSDSHNGSDAVLDLSDFVFNLYLLQLTGITFQRKDEAFTASAWRQVLRRAYDHPSQFVQKLVKLTLLTHTLSACMYGLLAADDTALLDHALLVLLLVEAAEVGLKFYVYGPRRFWSCGQYNAERIFEQWENRTALVISSVAVLAWLSTRVSPDSASLGFDQGADMHRLLLVAPTLRLFFVLKTARRIIFVLVPLRTYLGSVMMLMLIFNIMWATLGVELFEGVFEDISNAIDSDAVRLSAFDSVGSAMLTLVQMLVGEGWHSIMYGTMNGHHSWYWAAYFILFVLVQTLLLTNLLVGVVLDSTTGFDEEFSLQRHVMHGDLLDELDELKESYASVLARTRRTEEEAARLSVVAECLGGCTGRRTSVLAGQTTPQEPAGACRPRHLQLLPQLSNNRILGRSEMQQSRQRRTRSVACTNQILPSSVPTTPQGSATPSGNITNSWQQTRDANAQPVAVVDAPTTAPEHTTVSANI